MAYYVFDYESGEYVELPEDIYNRYKSSIEYFRPTIQPKDGKIIGKIISTLSNPDDGENEFYTLWQENNV